MRTKCICGTATSRPVAGRPRKGPKFSGPRWVPVIVERKATIEAIAERAGIAVSTVYSIFGSLPIFLTVLQGGVVGEWKFGRVEGSMVGHRAGSEWDADQRGGWWASTPRLI
jgi:hypothetical protein